MNKKGLFALYISTISTLVSTIALSVGMTIALYQKSVKGNGTYGISKVLMNLSYVLLDINNKYAGYVNILRHNANNNNAEIEIGIKPGLQGNDLGKRVVNEFYNQLFSIGYASVTSAVFSFNEPSLRLHEKVAKLNGTRIESYYINNRLWDMSFYSKVNNLFDNENNKK